MARKKSRKGMFVLGIMLAVIGVVVLTPSVIFYNNRTNLIQQCSTLLGQLSQFNAVLAQHCNKAYAAQSGYLASTIVGIIMWYCVD
jgi:hypothetical protein